MPGEILGPGGRAIHPTGPGLIDLRRVGELYADPEWSVVRYVVLGAGPPVAWGVGLPDFGEQDSVEVKHAALDDTSFEAGNERDLVVVAVASQVRAWDAGLVGWQLQASGGERVENGIGRRRAARPTG